MQIIKTKSFELAINTFGNKEFNKLAILLPGRLDTKDYICFSKHAEYLANKGFYVISFDPPGTWDSPGSIELFTTTNYIKAVNELVDYFNNRSTLLLGHSRGGATAILAGCKNDSVKVIVTVNASFGKPTPPDKSRINGGLVIDYRDLPPGNKKTKKQKEFIMPMSYFVDGNKYNDAEVLKECNKPRVMFYSVEDEFNTPTYVKSVFESAKNKKYLFELEGTHDYRYYPKAIDFVNHTVGKLLDTDFKDLF